MTFPELIQSRRAYRSLKKVAITDEIITALGTAAQLAPSCSNKQPWRFVFAYDEKTLQSLFPSISPGNDWARDASLIIAVATKRELDVVLPDGREFDLYDTGIASGFIMLAATDLGLTAHPIAGFDAAAIKVLLNIPEDMTAVSLIIVGARADSVNPKLSDAQKLGETQRPPRLPLNEIVFHNAYLRGER